MSASEPYPTGADGRSRSEAEIATELRLRPDPPRVMRLSRRAVSVLATGAGLGLGAILIVALRDRGPSDSPTELVSTERVQEAEGLAGLPRDYGDVPRLGPPLPGELGRAILRARERGEAVPAPVVSPAAIPPVDHDEQLRLQEQEAARLSVLFAEASTAVDTGGGGAATNAATSAPSAFPQPIAGSNESDSTEQRQAFLDREVDRRRTPRAADTAAKPLPPPGRSRHTRGARHRPRV